MRMDRRSFAAAVTLGGAAAVFGAKPALAAPPTDPMPQARNVVLVHGAYADGSCWSDVIPYLQARGLNVASVQNPLRTLDEDCGFARRTLAFMNGPTVLVAHSYSGMIASEVGVDPKVTALVYIAARAPDAGEDYTALAAQYPTPPASAGLVRGGDGYRSCRSRRSSTTSRRMSHQRGRGRCTRCRAGFPTNCSPAAPRRRPGATSRRSTRCRRTTARSIPTSSGSWQTAWAPRQLSSTPATCRSCRKPERLPT
jgi:pimeloyl-ACP methyl ester carboxylesterase